jgi:hypothetical protein
VDWLVADENVYVSTQSAGVVNDIRGETWVTALKFIDHRAHAGSWDFAIVEIREENL